MSLEREISELKKEIVKLTEAISAMKNVGKNAEKVKNVPKSNSKTYTHDDLKTKCMEVIKSSCVYVFECIY